MNGAYQKLEYSERALKAKAFFEQGYNCAQSVALAFCDETGLAPETAAKLASSFGAGMGRLREVCGAVSGALLVLGAVKGVSDKFKSLRNDFASSTVRSYAASSSD